MIETTTETGKYTHKAEIAGEIAWLNSDNMHIEIDRLMKAHPGLGIPHIVALESPISAQEKKVEPVYSEFGPGGQIVDESAKVRIEETHVRLNAAGVTVDSERQLYATGDRMARIGYETQNERKAKYDSKIPLRDAAEKLRGMVKDERREDVVLSAGDLAKSITVNGRVKAAGFVLTEDAIRGLLVRLEAKGAWGYAQGLKNRIVSEMAKGDKADRLAIDSDKAKLADLLSYECGRNADVELKLRARRAMGDCYAVVSPGYSSADADMVIEQIVDRMPADAKGSFSYDPKSTSWELRGEIWTPTPVAEQAVGEPFLGYASFRSKDNGRGSLDSGGGVELLACLNASTYCADTADASRVHRGKIMIDVDRMLSSALHAIDTLCEIWGTNRAFEIANLEIVGLPLSKAIPGLWWGELLDRKSELACLPGRTAKHVEALTEAYFDQRRDDSKIVRSDFAQAYTRYIQDLPADVRREAESAVGTWLSRPRQMNFAADRIS